MPPKKGKGKKGKAKAVDPNKLTQVDRTFCELTITDLNQKLARLRTHLASLDDTNVNLTEKMRELNEDRTDITAHLERTLEDRNDTISELEERLIEITKVREEENARTAEQIRELEAKYRAMHDQLTSEIKLLNGKLNSLDEFRVQRDVLLAKFDDQESDLKEKDHSHKEAIHNLEQKALVEKDALKKQVEIKLLQVSEDFTRSSEIRNAGYTRRLIRENIALQKEIDTLVLSHIKMQQTYAEQQQRHKDMSEQYAALDQMKKQLIRSSQNKLQIIEKLTTNYEKLKAKYVELLKYRKLYESSVKQDVCERFTYNDMSKKLRILGQRIEQLKSDKTRLLSMHQQHEAEILRLKGVIQQIKSTVQVAIDAIKGPELPFDVGALGFGAEDQQALVIEEIDEGAQKVAEEAAQDAEALRKLKRHDLLTELMEIVSSHSDRLPETPSLQSLSRSHSSLYRPGRMGFLPYTATSLLDLFKREARKVASVEIISPEYQLKQQDSKIIPKARSMDGKSIVDVEMGSTLYASSSHEELEVAQVEEEPGDGGEEASSSDYRSSESAEAAVAADDVGGTTTATALEAPSTGRGSQISRQPSVAQSQSSMDRTSHSMAEAGGEEEEDDDTVYFFY